jgi:flavin reductase (DIM6/NTAB) family NADH-FMN oxidoreductase RutF
LKKRKLGSCVTFFPQPATLVATQDAQGDTNLMMASWVGIVSKTPPTMAISLHHNRKTYANIMASRGFSVNVVPANLVVEADACGLASGNKVDKPLLTGLETSAGVIDGVPIVADSPLNVECRYLREVELGDYCLVMGEIVEIHACESAFDEQGHADIKTFDPLVYLGGLREYWSLGKKEADAYRAGLALLEKG